MDVLTPIVTGAMLTVFTVVLHLLVKGQIDALKEQVVMLKDQIQQQGSDIGSLRSDLTQVALAVGANLRPKTG